MAILDYKNLISKELATSGSSVDEDLVDTHWARFASCDSEEERYLLAKRAVAKSLLSRSRKLVDTQTGFDEIKASQTSKNLKAIIDDIDKEIEEQYPDRFNSNGLTTLSPELGLFYED